MNEGSADKKPDDELVIGIYRQADGNFTLKASESPRETLKLFNVMAERLRESIAVMAVKEHEGRVRLAGPPPNGIYKP